MRLDAMALRFRCARVVVVAVGVTAVAVAGLAVTGLSLAAAVTPAVATMFCPGRSSGDVAKTSWLPARRTIVPGGAVSMRVCRYNGDNAGAAVVKPAPYVLLGESYITGHSEIVKLAARLDRVAPDPRAVHSCLDEDIGFLVLIRYRGGHRLAVSIDSCLIVSNGASRARWVFASPTAFPLITELVRVTGGNATPWESR